MDTTIPDETTQFTKRSDSSIGGISVRGIIVLLIVTTLCAMNLMKIPVVEPLYSVACSAIAYYFGQATKSVTPLK